MENTINLEAQEVILYNDELIEQMMTTSELEITFQVIEDTLREFLFTGEGL